MHLEDDDLIFDEQLVKDVHRPDARDVAGAEDERCASAPTVRGLPICARHAPGDICCVGVARQPDIDRESRIEETVEPVGRKHTDRQFGCRRSPE